MTPPSFSDASPYDRPSPREMTVGTEPSATASRRSRARSGRAAIPRTTGTFPQHARVCSLNRGTRRHAPQSTNSPNTPEGGTVPYNPGPRPNTHASFMTTPPPTRRSIPSLAGVLMVVAALGAAIAAVIACDAFPNSRAAQDQNNYHLRVIRTFAQEGGNPTFSDYRSATTPGYHLTLAAIAR